MPAEGRLMPELTERIQLTDEQRELLLKHAFPSTRLLASPPRFAPSLAQGASDPSGVDEPCRT
jgi:hypothetical protein